MNSFDQSPICHASYFCADPWIQFVDVVVAVVVVAAAKLAAVLAGASPAGGACPVATVVIPGGGKGDRPVESPEVKVFVGRKSGQIRQGGKQIDRPQRKRTKLAS